VNEAFAAALLGGLTAALLTVAAATRVDGMIAYRAGLLVGSWSKRRFSATARSLTRRVGSVPLVRRLAVSTSLRQRLLAARWDAIEDELAGVKALLAVAGGSLTLFLPWPGWLLCPGVGILAFRVPDVVLARAARRRALEANAEIPQLLDLLGAASSAGLSGPMALRRAAEAVRGPLAEDIADVLHAVELGGRWRDELRRAADLLALPDLRRAVAALTRSETLGSSLSEAMTELASQVREARRAAASERARKAPVKMLFPLVFLVLPAFLLLTVVPVLVATLRSIQ
jgi:tight adherence protein C